MDGRKYNQAVRLHKLVHEALIRLAWIGFLSWLQASHTDDVVHVDDTLKTTSNLSKDVSQASHTDDVVHMDDTLKTTSNLSKDVSQASLKQVFQNRSCARIMYLFEVYLEFASQPSGCPIWTWSRFC